MPATCVPSPTSRCRFGISRCKITPPVGMYHRMWGAALHDRSEGIHRPLTATVVALAPDFKECVTATQFVISIDLCLVSPRELNELIQRTSQASGISPSQINFAFSHTHASGYLNLDRSHLPGGDLIPAYLENLPQQISAACLCAQAGMVSATLTYATASCGLAALRDYWDEAEGRFVCGYTPDQPADQTVMVVRASDDEGKILGTIVNYACHPTTLAWDNRLVSPDYVGALRELVEQATRSLCSFVLGACGDLGPVRGFVGDPRVADQNGRQLGYAVLSALEGMPPPGMDYVYRGTVYSGATIGVWEYESQSEKRRQEVTRFRHHWQQLPLPYRPELPIAETVRNELEQLEQQGASFVDPEKLREWRASVERKRRLLDRVSELPLGDFYPFDFRVLQLGDAFLVSMEGEPYHKLQVELRRRFAPRPVIVATINNGTRSSYIASQEAYQQPGSRYQIEIAVLAKGSLERITEAISQRISTWISSET